MVTGSLRSVTMTKSDMELECRSLAQVLSQCTKLLRLDLSGSKVAGFVAVANILTGLTSLTTLDLEGLNLTRPTIDQIGDSLEHFTALQVLNLGRNFVTPSITHLSTISNLSILEHLDIKSTYHPIHGHLPYNLLQLSPALVHLDLENHPIPADWLRNAVGELSHLRFLSLRSCRLQDIGALHVAQILAQCSLITALDLSANDIGHDGGMELARELLHVPALLSLDLSSNALDPASSQRLFEAMSRSHLLALASLSLANNPCFGDGNDRVLRDALASCPRLQTLNLQRTRLTTTAVTQLAPALAYVTALLSLDLSRNDLDGPAAVEVAAALNALSLLHTLVSRLLRL